MNMNKKIIIVVLLSLIIFPKIVLAADSHKYAYSKCTYPYGDKSSCVIEVESDGKGKVDISHNCETSLYHTNISWSGLSSANFIDNKKNTLKCPSSAFITVTGTKSANVVMSFVKSENASKTNLDEKKSSSNGKALNAKNAADDKSNYISCDYGNGITLRGNGTEIISESNGSYTASTSGLDPKDFVDKSGKLVCPYYNVSCQTRGMNVCVISKSSDTGTKVGTEAKNYDEVEKELKGSSSNSKNSEVTEWKNKECSKLSANDCKKRQDCSLVGGSCSDAQVASNPCDEDSLRKVLKIFGYVLMIMKFTVPLLIIGFGIFDLYKSVVDKDEKSLSKQIKMIGIRLICGLIVFFLPTIIYAFLDGIDNSGTKEKGYKTCAECVLKPTTNNLCTIAEDSD